MNRRSNHFAGWTVRSMQTASTGGLLQVSDSHLVWLTPLYSFSSDLFRTIRSRDHQRSFDPTGQVSRKSHRRTSTGITTEDCGGSVFFLLFCVFPTLEMHLSLVFILLDFNLRVFYTHVCPHYICLNLLNFYMPTLENSECFRVSSRSPHLKEKPVHHVGLVF